jgi:hypothetical protein
MVRILEDPEWQLACEGQLPLRFRRERHDNLGRCSQDASSRSNEQEPKMIARSFEQESKMLEQEPRAAASSKRLDSATGRTTLEDVQAGAEDAGTRAARVRMATLEDSNFQDTDKSELRPRFRMATQEDSNFQDTDKSELRRERKS